MPELDQALQGTEAAWLPQPHLSSGTQVERMPDPRRDQRTLSLSSWLMQGPLNCPPSQMHPPSTGTSEGCSLRAACSARMQRQRTGSPLHLQCKEGLPGQGMNLAGLSQSWQLQAEFRVTLPPPREDFCKIKKIKSLSYLPSHTAPRSASAQSFFSLRLGHWRRK